MVHLCSANNQLRCVSNASWYNDISKTDQLCVFTAHFVWRIISEWSICYNRQRFATGMLAC